MFASNRFTVKVTLVPTKVTFPQPFKWTPPQQLQPILIHTIKSQQCGCCAPLFTKATTKKGSTPSIMDIDEDTPDNEDLFYSLQTLVVNTVKEKQQLKAKLIDLLDNMEIELS